MTDHDDRRECARLFHKEVVTRNHDLFARQTETVCDFFEGGDRRSVDVGLTGLAEPPVAYRETEALHQGFQGRGSAIHRGGLNDFGDQAPTASHSAPWDAALVTLRPATRSTSEAGEICSSSISTSPGRP